MKLGQLRAFHAVHTLGSTVAAARQLGLSQSAVSSLLSQFEQVLGFPLYQRNKGRLQVRPEADTVFAQVQSVLDEVDKLTRLADSICQQHEGVLRIGIPGSLSETLMVFVLKRLHEESPDAKVHLHIKPYDTIQSMVVERKIDVGVVKLPLVHRDLEAIPLITAPTVVVMPKGHPLARHKYISPRELEQQKLIVLGGATTFWEGVEHHINERGVRAEMASEVHDTRAACRLVEAGLGLAFANSLMVSQYRHLDIAWRPFVPDISHHFCLIYNRQMASSRLFDRLCALMKEAVADVSDAG